MAMQRNYFTVLFFLKKSKLLKNGEAPICMRITINGKRAEVQIKRSIDVTKWNTQKECAIGREKKYQEINHYLDTIRTKILQIHRELEQDGKPITADIIKNIYLTISYLDSMINVYSSRHVRFSDKGKR